MLFLQLLEINLIYMKMKITDEEAKEFAYNNNIHCYLKSARNNIGINNKFEELGNLYLEPTFQEKRKKKLKKEIMIIKIKTILL